MRSELLFALEWVDGAAAERVRFLITALEPDGFDSFESLRLGEGFAMLFRRECVRPAPNRFWNAQILDH